MDTISGIPAHPLFVHIPVVLLPLAALGAVLLVIKASWNERYKWAVLVVTGVGAIGAILAAGAGESLEEAMPSGERAGIHDHAEMGDTAKALAILFFIGVVAWVVVPWFLNRKAAQQTNAVGADVSATRPGGPTWLKALLAVIMLGTAGASVVTIIDAGHSGAKKVWQEEGGEDGDDEGVDTENGGDDDGD